MSLFLFEGSAGQLLVNAEWFVLGQLRSVPQRDRRCAIARFYTNCAVHPLNKPGGIVFSRFVRNEWLVKRIAVLFTTDNILVVDSCNRASERSVWAISAQNGCLDDRPLATANKVHCVGQDSEDVLDENIDEQAAH